MGRAFWFGLGAIGLGGAALVLGTRRKQPPETPQRPPQPSGGWTPPRTPPPNLPTPPAGSQAGNYPGVYAPQPSPAPAPPVVLTPSAPTPQAVVTHFKMSDKARAWMRSKEGMILRLYNDPAAPDPGGCTVGAGHLLHKGYCDGSEPAWALKGGLPERRANARAPRDTLTQAEAFALYDQDVAVRERIVKEVVEVPLNQGQFDALVSFVYNVGSSKFRSSTLLRKLNAGDYRGAAKEFDRWVGSARLPGLVARRAQERTAFEVGVWA